MQTLTHTGSAPQEAVDLYRQPGPASSLYLSLDALDDPRLIVEAKVAMLLIGYDAAERRTTWLGIDRRQVALTFAELAPLKSPVHGVPLADAFIGAALATGAEVRVVPADVSAELPDGVGAVLRLP
jgi:hypothetical protein